MKGLVLSIIVVSGLSVLASNAFAENLFYGSSSLERLYSATPGASSDFEIKIQYTVGPYQIEKLTPVFGVSPKDAVRYVQITANPLDGLSRNDVGRIQGTMSVDSQIPYDSVFVTVYFEGLDSDNTYKSAWTDSITVDVKRATPPEKNMSYSQFLDFCSNHDPTLWDFMSIDERLLGNLCGLSNIGERQWTWLNGTALDWRNFAQKSAEEYAADIPLYKEQGISDTLVVRTAVSGRDSFPPPMTGGISFSYGDSGKVGHYSSRIVVGLEGIDEAKYEPFECKHPVSGASIGRPLDLQYDITGGTLLDLCKNDDTNSVVAKIDAGYGGEVTLTIPKKVVYSLTSADCADDSELIILVDNEETLAAKSVHNKKDNVVTVTFPRGHHTIEFIGASILPDPSPVQYCGIVMGLDSLYMPPKLQVERGMKPDQVRCNDGLVLVTKLSDSSLACIKPETKRVLVERGWVRNTNAVLPSGSAYDPYNVRCSSGIVPLISEHWQSLGMRPSDKDWETLGRHLLQQRFYEELKNSGVVFEPACFGVIVGGAEESYPPRFAMCTAVTALNGTQLYLEGTVSEFDITYFNIDNKMPYQCDEHHSGCLCQLE